MISSYRNFEGFDFDSLTRVELRNGTHVKITLPGSATISGAASRLQAALAHIDAECIIVTPDCGLGYLPREIVLAKLKNMVTAVY